jgi:hypothetical protein
MEANMNNQKKILIASIVATGIAISVMTNGAYAETTQDHYKEVIAQHPYTVEVCTQGSGATNGKSDITNFLEGAIVGGALGNNIKGENNGGAIGAFLGGVLNTERNKGSAGTQCRTETRYNETRQTIYSHSTVTFTHEGRQYNLRFTK